MKSYRIRPKEYISERFIMNYFDYTKRQAIKLYLEKYPQFTIEDLIVE